MKKRLFVCILIALTIMNCIPAQADMIKIPSNVCSAISDMSTSVEKLFASKNDVLSMMANLVMLDYGAYDNKYIPNYDNASYVGKTDTILYFAIPNSKGVYLLFGYLPRIDTLMYLGDDSRLNSAKEVESVMKGSCDDYKKLSAEEMLEGANYVLSIILN